MITYMIETDVDRWLPQKKPFRFIDKVIELKFPTLKKKRKDITPKDLLGSEVMCTFYTDENLDFFKGHFPDNPTLPGVIQIEMMAQAGSFLILSPIIFTSCSLERCKVSMCLAATGLRYLFWSASLAI